MKAMGGAEAACCKLQFQVSDTATGISFGKCFGVCQTVKKDLSRCMFWGQNMGLAADETLKLDTTDHSEVRGVKGMSGDGV
jgi:hypothetical protein